MKFKKYSKIAILASCVLLPITYSVSQKEIRTYVSDLYFDYKNKNKIKKWFNRDAKTYDPQNLHHGSAWSYLTADQFKEMVLDSISKMNPKIEPNSKIFEFGVGVGAALKVIETHIGPGQLELAGSDLAENAIVRAKAELPAHAHNFFVEDMTKKHSNIPDNSYDHVISIGAMAMYLSKNQIKNTIKEAVRITKPGGSILITTFIAPGGKRVGSIRAFIEHSFFKENAEEWGVENIKIEPVKYQDDRYLVTFNKKQ